MGDFHLRPGDRVCFYGDSITEQQLYPVYVESFVRTRFPKLDVSFFNRGRGGDTAEGVTEGGPAEERVRRDVKPVQPTVITVLLGMNDGGYVPYQPETEPKLAGAYRHLLDLLYEAFPRSRYTLMRTPPWDDYTRPDTGYNEALLKYGRVVQEEAEKRCALYVDLNAPFVELLKAAAREDAALAATIIADLIHPDPPGQLFMAAEILKAWNAPSLVSNVELDASTGTVDRADRAAVEDFDGLSWTQTDDALPWVVLPEDRCAGLVLRHCDATERLNRQILRVAGMPAGDYALEIDGEPAAHFSAETLAEGVNLATLKTPMARQSVKVLDLASKRSFVQFACWREVEFKHGHLKEGREAVAALERLESALLKEEIMAAQPRPHRFKLSRRP